MSTLSLPAAAAAPRSASVIIAISIGNALEWFDIVIYGFLAVTISKLFFPAGNDAVSLLITLGTFGVTFAMRPIGSFVLGAYADRAGRKKALSVSIMLMMLGTLIIVCAPTYAQIGLLAPTLVILARLVQGFAAGGEFGSATALLAEQDPRRRGYFASWQFASQGLTTLLAAGFGFALNALLTPDQLMSWGWRVPFVFGLLIGPAGLYIRRNLEESAEFARAGHAAAPVREAFVDQRGRLAASFGLIILATIAAYTGLFMPAFAIKQLGLPPSAAFLGAFLLGVLQFALAPVFGALSDRVGRFPVMASAAAILLVAIAPGFAFLVANPTLGSLLLVQGCMGIVASAYWGPISAAMAELFPAKIRGTGLSISYSCGVAIFGGFAPFISSWLIADTGLKIAPAFYVMFGAAASLVALVYSRRKGLR